MNGWRWLHPPREGFEPWLPLALAAFVYLPAAAGRGVIDYDEGNYSQAALSMIRRADWVTPYVNGVRFLEKPPLMYWLTAASLRAFGVGELALRLPTALAVIALVSVVASLARSAGPRAALVAGLATASSVGTYLFTRETLHDVWLVLFVSLAMRAFLGWYREPSRSLRHALVFYAALAGAVMTKSLVGVAFPLGIVAVFFLLSRERPEWGRLHVLPGSLLFLALAAPWHVLAARRNPGFLWDFFVNEQLLRFVGRHDPPVVWSMPLLSFWALVPVWFFPWTAFLPAAATLRGRVDGAERVLARLALAWAGVVLGFFSLSDRLEHYVFPALPALAILAAIALHRGDATRAVGWGFRGLAVLGGVLLAAAAVVAPFLVARGHGLAGASAARTSVVSETDFSILAEMPAPLRESLLRPAAVTIACLAAGFYLALRLEKRGRRLGAVLSLAAVMVIVFAMAHWSLGICEDLISSKGFALAVAREARPGDHLVVMGDFESANSLGFYEPLPLEIVGGVAYVLIPGMKYPDAPRVVLKAEGFEELWRAEGRVFALVPKPRLAELRPAGVPMLEALDRVLVRNR